VLTLRYGIKESPAASRRHRSQLVQPELRFSIDAFDASFETTAIS